ncbi:elongator complex protein 6 [Carex littledalei]|uniref:Elongator complex protein 6 n=1 Tax=Carex littledalei TaxID=544730 RepID=A0A833VWB1_9POAL|nr:elongator complex protein 6 [Carex littledalei]
MAEPGDLLAEAIGHSPPVGRVVLIGDCVEISGAFLLHLLLKRCLSLDSSSVVFIALSHPFSHYDRILRKMGCNLSVQRKNEKLHFLGLQDFSAGCKGNSIDHGFCKLYNEIRKAVEAARSKEIKAGCVFIMIDDLSLLEIAGDGSDNDVLDFVHYCATFTSKMDCSLIILNHDDVYSSEEAPGLLTHLQHISDIEIKAAPLNTGLAADVHGQFLSLNSEIHSEPVNGNTLYPLLL